MNEAVFEIWRCLTHSPDKFVFIHCTHGHNRTGYVIVCALIRMMGEHGMTVTRGVRSFAKCRTPGIYKDSYLEDLCSYHHEKRKLMCPETPSWRRDRHNEDEEGEGAEEASADHLAGPMGHDKILEIGEVIDPVEAQHILRIASGILLPEGQTLPSLAPSPCPWTAGEVHRPFTPVASHPSRHRSNLALLAEFRYRVTWKADGTRYMLFISLQGTYLIDRSGNVARVQMRFPTKVQKGPRVDYPVGPPHRYTLLDGEMVMDHDKVSIHTRPATPSP